WAAWATRGPAAVTLAVRPQGASAGPAPAPSDLHFFSDDGTVAYDLPQSAADDGHDGFAITLPISPDGPKDAPKLLGVLTSSRGWRGDGTLPGLRIDVVFGAAPSSAAGAPAPGAGGLAGTLALAFVGGLILNLMPCVFPVLGIKILGFVNQAGADRRKVTLHGLVFTAGVLEIGRA